MARALGLRSWAARRPADRRGLVRRRRQAAPGDAADARAPRGVLPVARRRFPATRLYGPYHHGGRSYYQWMARGTALVEDVLPLLEEAPRRRSTVMRPSGCGRCATATPLSSRASARRRASGTRGGRRLRGVGAGARLERSRRYGLPARPRRSCARSPASSRRSRTPRPRSAIRRRRSTSTWRTRSSRWSSTRCAAPARSSISAPAPAFPGFRSRSRCPRREFALVEATRASARSSSAPRRLRARERRGRARAGRGMAGRSRSFDLVTARALAPLAVVVEYAAPLLAVGGTLVGLAG